MKHLIRNRILRIVSIFLTLATLVSMLFPLGMLANSGIMYEHYDNVGDGNWGSCRNVIEYGQTFTPSVSHNITDIKVLAFRVGLPSTVILHVRDTQYEYDYLGEAIYIPIGDDLASCSFNANNLTTNTDGEWCDFKLSTIIPVNAGTTYCFYIEASSGNSSNKFCLKIDASWLTTGIPSGYANGMNLSSSDGGAHWGFGQYFDSIFEIWDITNESVDVGTPANQLAQLFPFLFLAGVIVLLLIFMANSSGNIETILLIVIIIVIALAFMSTIQVTVNAL